MSSSSTSMSKEKLKSELQSRNIPLPPTGSKKDVYVQLYQKYLSNTQELAEPRASEFSSDEEEAYKYTKEHMNEKSIFTSFSDDNDMTPTIVLDGIRVNITELSDDELRQYLIKYNVSVGPIVETTRSVYERKLGRLLMGDMEGEVQNGQHNNQAQDEYSDSDQEELPEPVTTPVVMMNSNNSPRKKKAEESPRPVVYNVYEPEPVVSKRNVSRDTPSVRRGLRDNISYTPIDRSLYGDLMRKQNEEALNKLASKVVENTPEPVKEKQRSSGSSVMRKLMFILLLVAIVSVIVYCTMEASNADEISHLPSSN